MTIHRTENYELIFECDGCGDEFEGETDNLGSALNYLHHEHWVSIMKKDHGIWQHFCPACYEKV